MNEHLDRKLTSANPISEEEAAGLIPPGVGEAMLREITVAKRGPVGWRSLATLFGGAGQARARAGFVAVLALVVLAVVGLNALWMGGADEPDLADPAGDGASIEVTTPTPDDQNGSPISVVTPAPDQDPSDTSEPMAESSDSPSTSAEVSSTVPQSTTTTTASQVDEEPCTAAGNSLGAAMSAYDQQCEQPRSDCDQSSGQWVCSSEQIGESPSGFGPANYFGDCVAIQAESFPLAGAWRAVDDPAANGGSYIIWDGSDNGESLETPADILSINFSISKPGNYRFAWLMRQPNSATGDEANNTWLNFPDADRFGSTGGGSFDGFANVIGFGTGDFVWAGKADEGATQSDIAIEYSRSGTYTLQIAGRSPGHQVDRIVVYPESVNRSDAIAGRCG